MFGPYVGELGNGGEKLVLLDDSQLAVEWVEYDDEFPWPIGADALGNNKEDLPAETFLQSVTGAG